MTPYDPNLKEAMAELREICAKRKIAGYFIMVSPTHSEFGYEITPEWGCAQWEDKAAGKLRFKAKTSELGKETCQRIVEGTCHMICQVREFCARGFIQMDSALSLLRTQVDIEHNQGEPYVGDQ